jgi:hypothetical protein
MRMQCNSVITTRPLIVIKQCLTYIAVGYCLRTACEKRYCQLKVDKVLKADTNTRSTAECVIT